QAVAPAVCAIIRVSQWRGSTQTMEITIQLPDDYVTDAEDFGMLNPDTIVQVLRAELDNRIMQMVDAEVKAHRSEQNAQQDQTENE
ncbi:MAG: hypothetical protein AAF653_19330, partial [Chloroflexota bacterium]